MSDLYLKDAYFVDWRTGAMRRGDVRVEKGPEGGIEFVEEIPAEGGLEVIDCGGKMVTKSFAIGHHHIYAALARGMPPPELRPRDFVHMLESVWWKLDKGLDERMIRASALVTGIEAARNGCTFLIDHHSSPNAAAGSLHIIAEALEEVGLGHLLCYELSDRDGGERLEEGFRETEEYLKEHQGLVGLHASFTVSEELLERAVGLAQSRDTGIHIHVAEAMSDEEDCRAKYGKSVGKRLREQGGLDLSRTILAHCLHLDDEERELIGESAAWVVHCTESNQNNGVGQFDPRKLGDRVFVGTDGMHSNVLAGARAMFLEGQAGGGLSVGEAYGRMRRVHDYLSEGGFAGDGENNLVVLDYVSPTPVMAENWPGHVMYGLKGGDVETVIAEGRVVVKERAMVTVDVEAVYAEARGEAERLWRKLL